MTQAAEVRSIPALHEFREAFATFGEEVREALSAAEMEIRRSLNQMEEQLKHWQAMVFKCERDVATAKIELNRKKIERVFGRKPDITEQEENLRKAKAKLAHAQEKLEICRKWAIKFPNQVSEAYEGPGRQLMATLESDLPKGLAMLERRVIALEEYIALKAPPAPRDVSAPPPPPPVLPETPV